MLVGDAAMADAVVKTAVPGLDIVPADADLSGVEIELGAHPRRSYRLKDALADLAATATPYDYVLIDCPPSLNLLTVNAMTAADAVLVPLQCEFFALEGLTQLMRTVELVRGSLNPRLDIQGVVLTMYDRRNSLSDQVARDVRAHFGDKVYDAVIPRNVRVSEAPSFGKPALIYDLKCAGSQAYLKLAREVVVRERARRRHCGLRKQTDGGIGRASRTGTRAVGALGRSGASGRRCRWQPVLTPCLRARRRSSFCAAIRISRVVIFRRRSLRNWPAPCGKRASCSPSSCVPQPGAEGEYQIVAGERRWRAAQRAGLRFVPIVVREDLTDLDVLEIGVIENVQRADLNPLEEALAYLTLMDKFGRTQEQVAETVGKSRSHVANAVRLLSLPESVHALMVEESCPPTRAGYRCVARGGKAGGADRCGGIVVRQAEALAREKSPASPKPRASPVHPRRMRIPRRSNRICPSPSAWKVDIADRDGRGVITIAYATLEQLDDLCRRLSSF